MAAKQPDKAWKILFYLGAAAAWVAVLVFRRNLSSELIGFKGFGLFTVPTRFPVSAEEWMAFFQHDRLLGLVLFNLVDLVNYMLVSLVFLAVYGALRNTSRRWALTPGCRMAGHTDHPLQLPRVRHVCPQPPVDCCRQRKPAWADDSQR